MLNIPGSVKHFADCYRHQYATRPEETAYVFLQDGEDREVRVRFQDLYATAIGIAEEIQQHAQPGDRVVLLYQPGIEFIHAFTACLFAGVVAVPVYPPQGPKDWPRFLGIVKDAGVKLFCTSALVYQPFVAALKMSEAIAHLPAVATDHLPASNQPEHFVWPELNRDSLAFLQYTSGSTGHPKGVMVSHGNLIDNLSINVRGYQHGDDTVVVSWLPQYHDMGLIGNILLVPYIGRPLILMSPMHFLQKPVRWLKAISKYGATASGAPNFAYELCLRKVSDAEVAELDLSTWRFIYNGAEFVRKNTLERFFERFQSCGIRHESLCPIYGLAESTLIVTVADKQADYQSLYIDPESLHRGAIKLLDEESEGRWLVGCGVPLDQQVRIVNPDTRHPCPDLEVGEVWVSGSSVAQGYWGNPEATRETFQATIVDDPNSTVYLRTGDLGFLNEGELYITGRHKEMIVLDGRNFYPQDIEDLIQLDRSELRKGCGAAFAIERQDQECLVLVQELARGVELSDEAFAILARKIRAELLDAYGITLHDLVLIEQGSFLKTSSGKIRRRAMREKYLQGKLKQVHTAARIAESRAVPASPLVGTSREAGETTQSARQVRQTLVRLVAEAVGLAPAQIELTRPLSEYGLDSKTLVGLSGEISDALNLSLSPRVLYDYPTINALVVFLVQDESTEGSDFAQRAENAPVGANEPIAIIGMACRFPGAAESPEAFWQLLISQQDGISEVPESRWDARAFYEAGNPSEGKTNTIWGGFLNQVDAFDPEFFSISPREALWMDPQQRLLMETSWHALEHAGIAPADLTGSSTGVFIGISNVDYDRIRARVRSPNQTYAGTGNAFSIAANRLSYFYDFHGPSLAIDTACSSSLVAVHQAIRSLRQGECGLALAGGVNLILTPDLTITFSQVRMMAPDGRCKPFSDEANGYVRSEGCGVIVLKPLSAALAAGDAIWGVIKGSGISQDGRSNGLTAPNGPSQELAIRNALRDADVDAQAVSYVEAHGTGTPLGDPIEAQAIENVYGAGRSTQSALWVGSAKSNIGHLESAAGIAGLMKTVLALHHRTVPANLHYATPNRLIPWAQMHWQVPVSAEPLACREGQPIFAGVSGFGFGGTNAHVILQSAPETGVSTAAKTGTPGPGQRPNLLAISARDRDGLRSQVQRHVTSLSANATVDLEAYCLLNNVCRTQFPHRLAVRFTAYADLLNKLTELDWQNPEEDVYLPPTRGDTQAATTAWLFTGQGAQYVGMGQGLMAAIPAFRAKMEVCDQIYHSLTGQSIIELMNNPRENDEGQVAVNQTCFTQPALFCLEYSLASVWLEWGGSPDYLLGHSVGEYAAACVAGVFSLEDAIKLIEARGRLIQSLDDRGQMIAVFAHLDDVTQAIGDRRKISIAAMNGPGQIVVAGDTGELEEMVTYLQARNIESRPLVVSHAFHSPLMAPMIEAFRAVADNITYRIPAIPIVSTVTGQLIQDEIASSAYWCGHILAPVLFEQGMHRLQELGVTTFIEQGPANTLIAMGKRTLGGRGLSWIASLSRSAPSEDIQAITQAAGQAFVAGQAVAWSAFYGVPARRAALMVVNLPRYAFQRTRYWLDDVAPAQAETGQRRQTGHFLLGEARFSPRLMPGEMQFECDLSARSAHFVPEYATGEEQTIRLPVFMLMALQVAVRGLKTAAISIQDLEMHEDIGVPDTDRSEALTMHTFVDRPAANEVRMKCYAPAEEPSGIDGGRAWQMIASASVLAHDASRRPGNLSISQMKLRIDELVDVQEYQENCRDRGLFYGAYPRILVSELYRNDHESLGLVRLDAEEASWSPDSNIPDAHVQAVFQVLGVLCYEDSEHTFFPYRVSRVEIFEPPGRTGWVYVNRVSTWDAEERHQDLDMIWMSESGKVQLRIQGMKFKASKAPVVGLKAQLMAMSPSRRTRTLREFLLRIVSKALSLDMDQIDDDRPLLELGMDSLIAMEILGRVKYALDMDLNLVKLQDGASVSSLAGLIDFRLTEGLEGEEADWQEDVISPMVVLQKGEPGRIPLILVHPIGGSVFCYNELAHRIGQGQPVYALQAHAFIDEDSAPESIEEMATEYLHEIRQVQPSGPYLLGGWSLGGVLALELASRLSNQGEKVARLTLIDSAPTFNRRLETDHDKDVFLLNLMSLDLGVSGALLTELLDEHRTAEESLQALFKEAHRRGIIPQLMPFKELAHSFQVMKCLLNVMQGYEPPEYGGKTALFKAEKPLYEYAGMSEQLDWEPYLYGLDQVLTTAGNHFTLLDPENIDLIATYMRKAIRESVSTANRFFLPVVAPSAYAQKHQVLQDIQVDFQVKEAKARLALDESHPYFFDHPLDHVPGALVLQGIWQMLDQITAETDPDNPALLRYVSDIHIRFRKWIEKQVPTPLSLLLMDGGPEHLAFSGIVTQHGSIACELDLNLQYRAAQPLADSQQVSGSPAVPDSKGAARVRTAPTPKEVLHKHRAENVFISEPEQTDVKSYCVQLLKPKPGHLFFDGCHQAMADSRLCVEPLYLLESARQLATWAGHTLYHVPMGHPMNLISVDMRLVRPIQPGETLSMVHEQNDAQAAVLQDIVRLPVVIYSGEQRVGEIGITAQAVDKHTYLKQRNLEVSHDTEH